MTAKISTTKTLKNSLYQDVTRPMQRAVKYRYMASAPGLYLFNTGQPDRNM